MTNVATVENKLAARFEQLSNEAKATAEKLNKSVRETYARLEKDGNELLQNLRSADNRKKLATETFDAASAQLDELRNKVAGVLGLPTREEVEALDKKMASLTRKVNKLAKDAKAK